MRYGQTATAFDQPGGSIERACAACQKADRLGQQYQAARRKRLQAASDRASAAAERLRDRGDPLSLPFWLQRERNALESVPGLGAMQVRERIEWTRHDDAAQTLYGVGLTLQAALPLACESELRGRLEQVVTDIDSVVATLRAT